MGRYSHRLDLLVEGVLPFSFVLPPPPIPPPPPGTPPLEARARVTFPVGRKRNLATVQVFMVPEGLPIMPLPKAPPLVPQAPTDPVTISYFEVEIEAIRFGTSAVVGTSDRLPSFALLGTTISNSVRSPFGDLTGAPTTLFSSFNLTDEETGEADFVFFGGAMAGNHVSVCPTAKGFLRICG